MQSFPGEVMAQDALLATKFFVPLLRSGLISRPNLIERLNQGLECKLVLLSAPAGYGKTTLLGAWADEIGPSIQVTWLSLDEDDNDVVRFLKYVLSALDKVIPGIGRSAGVLLQPPQPAPVRSALITLINDITNHSVPIVLVLDDYHVINARSVHQAVAYLLEHMPANMHLVISTRADPPVNLARYRAQAQVVELRADELSFTHREAVDYLNQTIGWSLSRDDALAIFNRTEGWIAGLQMAAATMQGIGADHASQFAQAFTGSNRHILDYLIEEVLDQQPERVYSFLLRTSILERLTAPLCDAVLGQETGSLEIIDYLERENLFIVPLDNERQWYRYHGLFVDLLRQRLRQAEPKQIPILHRNASVWYKRSGLVADAIEHAFSARDLQWAADLIDQNAQTTLMRSEVATLMNWIDRLPEEEMRQRPNLCVYHAWALLLDGQSLEAVNSRLQTAGLSESISAEASVFRALTATYTGDAQRSLAYAREAVQKAPEDDIFLRSVVMNALGMAYVLNGEIEAAVQAFDQGAAISQKAGNVLFAVGALCNLAGMCHLKGQLRRAERLYLRALDLSTVSQGERLPAAGRALLGLGELAREWNRLEEAVEFLKESLELFERYMETGALVSYLHLARVKQSVGDQAGAELMLQHARQIAERSEATRFDDLLVAAAQTRMWIEQGNLDEAWHWAEERGLVRDPRSGSKDSVKVSMPSAYDLQELELLLSARVYIARERYADALEVLKTLEAAAEGQGRVRRQIETLILSAIAASKLSTAGHIQPATRSAWDAFMQALDLAEPEGYIRLFIDEGEPVAALLRQAAEREIHIEYVNHLLSAMGRGAEPRSPAERPGVPYDTRERVNQDYSLVEPLSDRELEVLSLIAQGLSNRDIAERLVISLSTVKGHAANIYGKLGVNKRTQAVARARILGILP